MKQRKKNKNINIVLIVVTILVSLLLAVSSGYLIYNITLFNGIENFIRNCAIVILILITLVFIFCSINLKIKGKKIKLFILLSIMVIMSVGELYISSIARKADDTLNRITSDKITYSTSIVTLSSSSLNNINDVKSKKIGMIDDTTSIDAYVIAKDIISENKISNDNIVVYEDFYTMMDDLYAKKIDAVFLMTNYTVLFNTIEKIFQYS